MAVFLSNLSSPPLLFFFLGVAAVLARSDLEIPAQIAKSLSLYLLFAIGFKGGVAISESTIDATMLLTLLSAVTLSALIPVYTFVLLRRWFPLADAAAIAATYGSVSAVTFVTATGYLDMLGIQWSGYLVAAMALMESPAIIVGIVLYKFYGGQQRGAVQNVSWKALFREALFNGSVLLILGSMLIGWITGADGMQKVQPLVKDLFLGLLCLFLLDMGIVAARRFSDLPATQTGRSDGRSMRPLLLAAMLLPALNALVGLALAVFLGLSEGNALLLVVLAASASYIAVPAAMRLALPEANPGSYLTMSLAITFPLNLLVGIPAYHAAIRWLL
jgi:hypothetical protein